MKDGLGTVKAGRVSSSETLLIHVGLGLTLLLAAWLRFYRLAGQSLWSDEGNSVALARAGLAEIAGRTALDIHPPLYYWLLHGWMRVFGESEVAVRSLSATIGVLLVAVVYRLGTQIFNRRVGLLAAFVAAVSPFQVYYAQEARMYALLALLGALTVWSTVELIGVWERANGDEGSGFIQSVTRYSLLYVLGATLGLYTHYAFPLVLIATNLAVLGWLLLRKVARRLVDWLILQVVPLLLYLPWLPVAWRQLTTWPAPPPTGADHAWSTVWRTLVFGPAAPGVSHFWLIILGVLGLVGVVRLLLERSLPRATLLLLYLGLPIALTLILFKPAYLKFLLVASPALCLLLALGLLGGRTGEGAHFKMGANQPRNRDSEAACPAGAPEWGFRRSLPGAGLMILGAVLFLSAAWEPLRAYYTDPAVARDDYRGIARYLEAIAGPGDAIILNAAGQQEVFSYYFQGDTPVYPLPRTRPLDPKATVAELETLLTSSQRIFVLYWATNESDPTGVIETWLDEHAFKASDAWVGNVRLVSYAAPQSVGRLSPVDIRLGDHVMLIGYQLFAPPPDGETAGGSLARTVPGGILQVTLSWTTDAPLDASYKVFIQALDKSNHLVAQRDAEPAMPTLDWEPGQMVLDRHGLLIEPGTPPGEYRVIAGLYDAATGQRLPTATGDFVELGAFTVVKPGTPPPLEALHFQYPAAVDFGLLRLLGYERYKLGHSYDPDTPLRPGDPLHVVLYWQAQSLLQQDWLLEMQLVPVTLPTSLLAQGVFPAAGVDYPTTRWEPGEVVRAQFDLFLPGDAPPGDYCVSLRLVDEHGSPGRETYTLAPVSVE
jgi:mannosyltransferase